MFDNSKPIDYHVFEDYNIPFDEKGTTVGTVRKIQWVKEGSKPDESKAKVEIRKMYVNPEGEKPGKGYTFSTPEGPGELVVGMIGAGFGDTKDILRVTRKRKDFLDAAKSINEDSDDSFEGELFDMRDLLIGMDSNSEEEYEDEE